MLDSIQRYAGPLIAVLANLGFTLMDAAAQSCTQHGLAPGQVAFSRMLLTLPFIAIYIIFRQPALLDQLDPRSRPFQHKEAIAAEPETLLVRNPALAARLIWLRSFLTSVELCLMYAALSRIPLSEFVSVFMTRAFLIGFLCWILLKEAFGWRLQLAAGISTIAVALIVQPPFLFGDPVSGDAGTRVSGFLLCLACLIVDTLEMVVLRAIGAGPNPSIMMLGYATTCVLVGPCFMLVAGESFTWPTTSLVYFELAVVAGIGLVAQLAFVKAMQMETGGIMSVISYAQIPMSLLVQCLAVGTIPNVLQVLGMGAILISGVWAVISEKRKEEEGEIDGSRTDSYTLLPVQADPEGQSTK